MQEYNQREQLRARGSVKFDAFTVQHPVLGDESSLTYGQYEIQNTRGHQIEVDEQYVVIGRVRTDLRYRWNDKIVLSLQSISPKTASSISGNTRGAFSLHRAMRMLFAAQERFTARVRQYLTASQAQIVLGIVFGQRPDAQSGVKKQFQATGVIHVLVASGANIAIIAVLMSAVMRIFLPERYAKIASVIGVLCYAVIVGGDPPILRALCMYLWVMVAALCGRPVRGMFSLLSACFLLLIYQPFLIFSLSFGLSFLATFGMIVSSSLLKSTGWTAAFLQNAVIFLCTMPLVLYAYGSVPLTGIILTVLLSPFVSFLMIASSVSFVASLLPFSLPFAFSLVIVSLCSEIIDRLVNLFYYIPTIVFQTQSLSFFHLALLYFILCVVVSVHLAYKRRER